MDRNERRSLSVLMVSAFPPSTQAGGVSTVLRNLTSTLGREHRITTLINEWSAPRLREVTEAGQTFFQLRLRPPLTKSNKLRGFLGFLAGLPHSLKQLRRLLKDRNIDVVHLHFASSYQFYFRVLGWFGGPPYIVTLHRGDTVNFSSFSKLNQAMTLWTLRGAKAVVAVSASLRDLASTTFDLSEVHCVPNGVNVPPTARVDSGKDHTLELPPLPETFFLMVSNVTYYKAPDVAIKAWVKVTEEFPDLHLVIVGEPREMWDECKALIETLGCGDRVHLMGPFKHSQVMQVMTLAQALVFPSRSEGLPMVLLEAGSVGLPVICSDIGPFLEVVENGTSALVFPSEDVTALSKKVIGLAGDKELQSRLAHTLKARVESEFSSHEMSRKYLDLYLNALEQRS